MSFWSKRIGNTYTLAEELKEDEKKVRAVKNSKIELKGKTLDRTLEAIQEEKIKTAIRNDEIWKWFLETDFKKLRLDFGYKTQSSLAKAIGRDVSTINRLEKNKNEFKQVAPSLIDIYYFYHNDFNRNVVEDKKTPKKQTKSHNWLYDNRKKILNWYKKADLVALRGTTPQYEMAKKIGIPAGSLSDLELHKIKNCSKNVIKLYRYYNKEEIVDDIDNTIFNWYKSVDDLREYGRKFGYSKNKLMAVLNLSWDQIRDFEGHKYKSATPIVKKIYEFYHNEDNRLPEIEFQEIKKIDDSLNIVADEEKDIETNDTKTLEETNSNKDIIAIQELEIKHLKLKIEDLKLQLNRYEKLIDRL